MINLELLVTLAIFLAVNEYWNRRNAKLNEKLEKTIGRNVSAVCELKKTFEAQRQENAKLVNRALLQDEALKEIEAKVSNMTAQYELKIRGTEERRSFDVVEGF